MTLLGRIQAMIARAVTGPADDSRSLQMLQIELLDDEQQNDVERFQDYGFASVARPGAEAIAIFPAGIRSHGLVIVVADRRYRLRNLEQGEVALYDDQGQAVHIKRDGIAISSPFAVTITAPIVTIDADTVNLGGEGGAAVARVGDPVVGGHISAGSARVKAA